MSDSKWPLSSASQGLTGFIARDQSMRAAAEFLAPSAFPKSGAAIAARSFAPINSPRDPAEMAILRLGEGIADFEADLSDEEEVGGVMIGGPGGTFHITRYRALNMDLIVFEGLNEHRRPQRLIQHVSQVSISLTALPKLNETPRRIGFVVTDKDEITGAP